MVFIVTLVGDKNEINCGKNKDITEKGNLLRSFVVNRLKKQGGNWGANETIC